MIIVQLNRQIFEYDVHSLVKSFYPGEDVKIVYETSPEEADAQLVCRLEFLKTVSNLKPEDTLPEQACEKKQVPTSHIRFQIWKNGKTESEETAVCTQPDDRKELKNEVKRLVYRQLSSYTGQKLPWGNLTGIRPTKIPMAMLGQGYRNVEIADYMRKTYYTSNEKTSLAIAIANRERHLLKDINYQNGYSLYVGIPFCPSICLYCSFSSSPIGIWKNQVDAYLDALCKEIDYASDAFAGKELNTVFLTVSTFVYPHLWLFKHRQELEVVKGVIVESIESDIPEDLVQIFKVLGDKTRLRIIKLLMQNVCTTQELAQKLEISEAAVSKHLQIMWKADLVHKNKKGFFVEYEFKEDMINYIPYKFYEMITI